MTRKLPIPPPLYTTLMSLKREMMLEINCVKPGRIVSYDATARTAQVAIGLSQVLQNGNTANYPLLYDLPVIVLHGGIVGIDFPITAGDECLIFFSDRCIDFWHTNGSDSPQPPPDSRAHDLSDGFALVGLTALAKPLELALIAGEGGLADTQARVAINPMTHKIAISNNVEQLATLMTAFITTLTTIATVPGGGPLNAASIAALTAYIVRFNNLLYP